MTVKPFVVFLIAVLLLPGWAQAEPTPVSWSQLVDESVTDFDDPFKALSVSALSDISTVVRLRARLQSAEVAQEARPRLVDRLRLKEDNIAKAGIDLDWLLSQRWIIAEKRKAAAWASNPDLDGKDVVIKGYFLAGRGIKGEGLSAYLVPEAGMCSHMPPPPPNQLLRLELPAETEIPNGLYAPVELKGRLLHSRTERTVHVVDGLVPMNSAWSFEVSEMNVMSRSARQTGRNSPAWPRTITQ